MFHRCYNAKSMYSDKDADIFLSDNKDAVNLIIEC